MEDLRKLIRDRIRLGQTLHLQPVRINGNNYSSAHNILLVGEGDFSFSLSLATSFGSASKIVATSLDSEVELARKYSRAASNVSTLRSLGATVIHGVDAKVMAADPRLAMQKFNRIVFNFPHAGFKGCESDYKVIELHRELVQRFFCNANRMLKAGGEIHVTHKSRPPFSDWDLEELADWSALKLIETADFYTMDYPGYINKKGNGYNCDLSFPIGDAKTYKFKVELGKECYEWGTRKSKRQPINVVNSVRRLYNIDDNDYCHRQLYNIDDYDFRGDHFDFGDYHEYFNSD